MTDRPLMTLDEIVDQADELMHNGLANSPTDGVRLAWYLARWIKAQQKPGEE